MLKTSINIDLPAVNDGIALIFIVKPEYAVNKAANDNAVMIFGVPDAEKRGYVRR
jgi:hypothetical protein